MRHILSILTVGLSLLTAAVASAANGPFLQIHFSGSQKITADPGYAGMATYFGTTEFGQLTAQTLNKLAHVPRVWLKEYLPPTAVDGSDLIRPLLDDMAASEWYLSAADAGHAKPDVTVAIRLTPARVQIWNQNLSRLLANWGAGAPQNTGGATTWQVPGSGVTVRLEAYQGWLIFSAGSDTSVFNRQYLANRRAGPWLTVDADCQHIAQAWPELQLSDLPVLHLRVTGYQTNLQVNARAEFAGAAPVYITPWQVPVRAIHSPFVSFTAARGFGPWLEKQGWYQPLEISPTPDQLFTWALPQIPFQTYVALPSTSAADTESQVFERLQNLFQNLNAKKYFVLPFSLKQTNNQTILMGMPPFISPNFQTWKEQAGEFLLFGLFPNTPSKAQFPQGILSQLNQPDILYYHWELTGLRLPEFLRINQFSLMLSKHKQLDANSPSFKWIARIGPKLGPTVTSVTLSKPNELTLNRNAPVGLTAVELYTLGDWLEATNFPGCDLSLPPLRHLKHRPIGSPSPAGPGIAPMAPAPMSNY